MATLLNLQNSPTPPTVASEAVDFRSGDAEIRGSLYRPTERNGPLPAVVVSGAWTTVKEQMGGTYARELAARGYVALAFDFRGWGESGGSPRYVEDPMTKTEDIHAAVSFIAGCEGVDKGHVFGMGICASSGYP